jgi:hypothetical protein
MGLHDNCMRASHQRVKEFFVSIHNLLREVLTKPLPSRLLTRARYDHKMVKIVIQRTDKSKVFHLASLDSYYYKSLEYMQKTNAYKEIESGINPCMDHLQQVLKLIDSSLKNKSIDLKIWQQYMYPNIQTIELAYLYFIPKPHMVNIEKGIWNAH